MDDERYQNLVEWHRATQRQLGIVQFLLMMIFIMTVIAPILQQFGWWNILNIGG